MTICGYNETIGEGLRLLAEGMILALEEKASKSSVAEVMQREFIELDAMIEVLRSGSEVGPSRMFLGLNILAKSLFLQVNSELQNGGDSLRVECTKGMEAFVQVVAMAEQMSIQLHLQNSGKGDAAAIAREVASWVVAQSARKAVVAA